MNKDNPINPEQENLEELKLEWDARYTVLGQKQDDLAERITVLENSINTFRSKGAGVDESDLRGIREYFGSTCEVRDAVAEYLDAYSLHVEEFNELPEEQKRQFDFSYKIRLASEETRVEISRERMRDAEHQFEKFNRFLSLDLSEIYRLEEDGRYTSEGLPEKSVDFEQESDVVASGVVPVDDRVIDAVEVSDEVYSEQSAKVHERRKGGYISSISIENFKGIGEKVTIPLKPITLMFGANSAGKSTVLQALLYAHEVLNNNNPDADKTEFGGEWVNLGGFQNLVHNHDLSKEITIGIEYILDDDGLPLYGPERGNIGVLPDELFYANEVFHSLQTAIVQFTVKLHESTIPFVSRYQTEINGEPVAAIRKDNPREKAILWHLDLEHVIDRESGFPEADDVLEMKEYALSEICKKIVDQMQQSIDSPEEALEDVDYKISKERGDYLACLSKEDFAGEIFSETKDWASFTHLELPTKSALPAWGQLIPFNFENHEDWELGENVTLVYSILSALIAGPGELVANVLKSHRYIGPIRTMPPRNYAPQHTKESSRWADGMAGWDALFNDVLLEEKWFNQQAIDHLGLGYCFKTKTSVMLDKKDDFPQAYEQGERIVRMQDVKNGIDMEPCDVGTGVSQVIPVVAGAMSPGCTFLSVEQPELHLHPAIQCNLGDLFISQMRRYPERTFLLETHSEHMILRLLRRIRETASNELEDQSLALTPPDVGVLYVDELEDGVSITELPINEEGDFTRKWPKGFFAERAEELF